MLFSKEVLRIAMPSFNTHFNEHLPCTTCTWCETLEIQIQKAQYGPSNSIQSNGIIRHRVVKFYNRDVDRILRSKKTGEVEKGRMSQVLKGRSGKVTLGKVEE